MTRSDLMFSALSRYQAFFSTHPLTRTNSLPAWLRLLRWQAQARIQGELVVPWVAGLKLAARRGMAGATANLYVGLHEFNDMALIMHYLKPTDLFADIGANIGAYSLLAAGLGKASVCAFEPDAENAQHLRKNLALNNLTGRATVHQCAVGDHDGVTTFTSGLDATNHIPEESFDGPVQNVRISKLDTVLAGKAVSAMKIDVEGHEDEVLRGAEQTMFAEHLQLIIIESVSDYAGKLIQKLGFNPCVYDPFTRRLSPCEPRAFPYNGVYIRDLNDASRRVREAPGIDVFGRRL